MSKYFWSNGSGYSGVEDSLDAAENELRRYVGTWIDEAIHVISPDGGTVYFYESQAEADKDRDDGAYAVKIVQVR